MIRFFVVTSAITLYAATSAHAADAVMVQEPAPAYVEKSAPVFTWAGAYGGAQVGYGWGQSNYKGTLSAEMKPTGFLGGIYAGYNFETGNNVVLGVDADVNYANLKKSREGSDDYDGVSGSLESQLRWEGAMRARAGYAVGRFLPYIAGGVAFGQLETSGSLTVVGLGSRSFSEKKTRAGWTAGAGVDYAATDNVILRLEYRYTDLGGKEYSMDGYKYNADFKSHGVRLGVAYKF
ncbi:porin family protein [Phyllobacterium salinisoli]|uniref:Porin family protein n=1 Tax=Phyllobacterium salinisoli TaxID=1899321 RepID=A0A368JZ81_9HYPH|nr:outer membrane protein [Phyllobacterium salinisoli]RCS21503.1 porin family protein [Phyllobacterium salinisoli]